MNDVKFAVKNLTLTKMGPQVAPVIREYVPNNTDDLAVVMANAYEIANVHRNSHHGDERSLGLFTKVANAVMDMSKDKAIPTVLPTENEKSWQDSVYAFKLKIDVINQFGSTSYIVGGYTDSDSENIGDLILIPNSIHAYGHYQEMGEGGPKDKQVKLRSVLLCSDPKYNGIRTADRFFQRPLEVINHLNMPPELEGVDVFDARNTVTPTPKAVAYNFIDNTAYMEAFILKAVMAIRASNRAPKDKGVGYKRPPFLSDDFALQNLFYGYSLAQDPLVRAIYQVTGIRDFQFRIRDLQRLTEVNGVNVVTHEAPGDLRIWPLADASHLNARIADIIFHHGAAVLVDNDMSYAKFSVSNSSTDYSLSIRDALDMHGNVVPFGGRTQQAYDDFRQRALKPLKLEAGSFNFNIEVVLDIFGTSYLNLTLPNAQPAQFRSPTFANSIFAPFITDNQKSIAPFAERFAELINILQESNEKDPE